jgi:sucrose-phosphate synthase
LPINLSQHPPGESNFSGFVTMNTITDPPVAPSRGLRLCLISLHGLIRGEEPELGRDADTGGQVKYVLELARALAALPEVARVDLLTRQIIDPRVGPEYARLEEQLAPKARLARIAFGPRRYLRKESLWPHVDAFVDQAVAWFRRQGALPDLIHGHYADAGYAGAQLARLLGIPYAFTGHSLGRVKRKRLLARDGDPARLEETYRFTERIEAEEFALETASLVVASTAQEVAEQYQIYDHYVPERMEVIPPGVDLGLFYPPETPAPEEAEARARLLPFLRDPDKPVVLAMARPDERKNLELLVRVFGASAALRARANLVLVLGCRDDLRQLPAAQRRVLQGILTLVDVYDLYGAVALPKCHTAHEVPGFYRLAARSRGVFVNPALTEPFGLTLLEAAASGLPVVATHDGGPKDILANCRNGLLVDPFDPNAIEQALLRVLDGGPEWDEWARNGVAGATRHYSWETHASRYLRDAAEVIAEAAPAALPASEVIRPDRRLPDFDRLLVTDLDNTLTGDAAALDEFRAFLNDAPPCLGFGIATGRSLPSALELIDQLQLPRPDLLVSAVGTRIHYGKKLTPDRTWARQIAFQWNRAAVLDALAGVPGLALQDESQQADFKVSYTFDRRAAPPVAALRRRLRERGVRVKVVASLGQFLDVIPIRAGDGLGLRHVALKWGFSPEHLLVAGDSGNDEEMLKGRTLGVVVGNHSPELEKLRNYPRIYFAAAGHARGILEGVRFYNFLGHITIPNDRIDDGE